MRPETTEKLDLAVDADLPLRSLSGILDFDCAARLESFVRAAETLHKTPAAVSLQIRQLEASLGFPLFARHPRRVVLTERGRAFAETVARALRSLRTHAAALRDQGDDHVLRISTTHTFALKWLVPRLGRFAQRHPEIDTRIDASDQPVDLEAGGVDAVIRHAPAIDEDPALLCREHLVAVYAPALCGALRGRMKPADVPRFPLLYERSPEPWRRFFEAHRLPAARAHLARGHSHWGTLAQAAVAGQGVALVTHATVYDDLSRGALLRVRAGPQPYGYGYRLLIAPGRGEQPKLQWFRAWLADEMAEMRRSLALTSP